VLLSVEQHVRERVADLAWRCQRPTMVTINPNTTRPLERAVESARHSNSQAADPCGQRGAILCLADEVDVVGVHRELRHPKGRTRSDRNRGANGAKRTRGT
jgi:hypothetical protein